MLPLHTHDDSGKIHVEADVVRDFKLQDFFDVWDRPFSQTKVLDFTGTVTMTVDGQPSTAFGSLILKDGQNIVLNVDTTPEPPPAPPPDPTPTPFDGKLFAIGDSAGQVQVRRSSDGSIQADFAPYGSGYQGRVSVALGDINGDGVEDLVTGATVGSPHVKVFDGKAIKQATFQEANPDAHLLASWMAYETRFNVGVNVALGKVSGSSVMDIVTGASVGNPHVKVYRGSAIAESTFAGNPEAYLLASYFAYSLNVNLGATVAVGAVSGSQNADVITGSTGGNPHVKVYRGAALANGGLTDPEAILVTSYFAFDTGQNFGVNVAIGDTNADSFADIIVGPSFGDSLVKVYNGKLISEGSAPESAEISQFMAYDARSGTGVSVGTADFDGDGAVEILTGSAQGTAEYRVVKANSAGVKPPAMLESTITDLNGGISIGG
jgi:hypothetical protein